MFKRLITLFVIVSFILSYYQPVYAQDFSIDQLPEPGTMVSLSSAYEPVLIKGLKIDPAHPLALDFIVATGNSQLTAQDPELKKESEKLIKYFFAALTLPEKDVWVNLSPYEKDRIIPKATGETEMGRDMLAQDYILKQITASLIYPERGLGKEFWNKIYTEAYQRFGSTQIPVNTFNKVWIVADKASVYESRDTVFVVDSHLKVMLEEDYMALNKHQQVQPINNTQALASRIVREIVLPALEKEVNEGKNFANLRQIFHSLILAKWYKETLKNALLNQVYSNKDKIAGLSFLNTSIGNPQYIYQQYLKAYKKGVFNYIKEDIDQTTQQPIPRKYFSGGVSAAMIVTKASAREEMIDLQEEPGQFVRVDSKATISNQANAAVISELHVNRQEAAVSGNSIWNNKDRRIATSVIVPLNKAGWLLIADTYGQSGSKLKVELKVDHDTEKSGFIERSLFLTALGDRDMVPVIQELGIKVDAAMGISNHLGFREQTFRAHERKDLILEKVRKARRYTEDLRDRIRSGRAGRPIEQAKIGKYSHAAMMTEVPNVITQLTLDDKFGSGEADSDTIQKLKEQGLSYHGVGVGEEIEKLKREEGKIMFINAQGQSIPEVNIDNLANDSGAIVHFIRDAEDDIYVIVVHVDVRIMKTIYSAFQMHPPQKNMDEFLNYVVAGLSEINKGQIYWNNIVFPPNAKPENFSFIYLISPKGLVPVDFSKIARLQPPVFFARVLNEEYYLMPTVQGPILMKIGNAAMTTAAERIFTWKGIDGSVYQAQFMQESTGPQLGKVDIYDYVAGRDYTIDDQLSRTPLVIDQKGKTVVTRERGDQIIQQVVYAGNRVFDLRKNYFERGLEDQARSLGYSVNEDTKFILQLGDTLDRSRYYVTFNAGLKMGNENIILLPVKTMPAELERIIRMGRLSEKVIGFNMTSPHKINVIPFLDGLDQIAQITGAVEAVVKQKDGTLKGYSGDGEAWVYWYTQILKKSLQGKKIVVLGAGGAARSLIHSIGQDAPFSHIVVYDRQEGIANILKDDLGKSFNNSGFDLKVATISDLNDYIKESDMVINLTGSGKSYDDQSPPVPEIDYNLLRGKEAIDANYRFVYDGAQNEFLKRAKEAGAATYNGLGLSVATIPLNIHLFTGKDTNYQDLIKVATAPVSEGGAGFHHAAMTGKIDSVARELPLNLELANSLADKQPVNQFGGIGGDIWMHPFRLSGGKKDQFAIQITQNEHVIGFIIGHGDHNEAVDIMTQMQNHSYVERLVDNLFSKNGFTSAHAAMNTAAEKFFTWKGIDGSVHQAQFFEGAIGPQPGKVSIHDYAAGRNYTINDQLRRTPLVIDQKGKTVITTKKGDRIIQQAEYSGNRVLDLKNNYEDIGRKRGVVQPSVATTSGVSAAMAVNGGIDLNASKLNLQRQGSGVQIKFDPATIECFKMGNFDGIVPVITRITPIADIYPLLGLKEPEENEKAAA